MSTMDGFFVLDSDNSTVGDKHIVEKTSKGYLGSVARKRLADISNLPQQPKPSTRDEKSQFIPTSTKEYIDQLQKENMTLKKILVDRNKIIELSGVELQKLRINLQKVQHQNLQLAQAHSQMLAELNTGKDRLKSLQHELGCKNGVLIAKRLELQEKEKPKTCPKNDRKVGTTKCEESSSQADRDVPGNTNRKQKSKSLGPGTVKQVQAEVKAENKRLCLRRQSARFKSVKPEPTEDLFEIDVAKFPACSVGDDHQQEDYSTSLCSPVKIEDAEENTSSREGEAQELRISSSIGRPSRLAAKKVQSYKEISINVKMRRNG